VDFFFFLIRRRSYRTLRIPVRRRTNEKGRDRKPVAQHVGIYPDGLASVAALDAVSDFPGFACRSAREHVYASGGSSRDSPARPGSPLVGIGFLGFEFNCAGFRRGGIL